MGFLGAHISISGGFEKAVVRAESFECQAIQIFSKNQRQWTAKPIKNQSRMAYLKRRSVSSIRKVLIHASYLINLASPDPVRYEMSREACFEEIRRASILKADGLVLHPGSHMGAGVDAGIERIVESLCLLMESVRAWGGDLLLENTPGCGSQCGSHFNRLMEIIQSIPDNECVGICFDTAHAFSAGYDLRTRKGYDSVFNTIDKRAGLKRLRAFHLNDTQVELGSRRDRHEHIGRGSLGEKPFRWLVNDKRFLGIPMILETPGGEPSFEMNLNRLRSFIES